MALGQFNEELFDSMFQERAPRQENLELSDGFYHMITTKGKVVTRKRSGQEMIILEMAAVEGGKPNLDKMKPYFFDLPSVVDNQKWEENFGVLLEKSEKIAERYGKFGVEEGAAKFFKDIERREIGYSGSIVKLVRTLIGSDEIARGYLWNPEGQYFVDREGNEAPKGQVQKLHKEIAKKAYNWLAAATEDTSELEGFEVYACVKNNQIKYLTSSLPEGAEVLAA